MALERDDGMNGNAAMRARVGDEAITKLIEQCYVIWMMLGVRPQRPALGTLRNHAEVRTPWRWRAPRVSRLHPTAWPQGTRAACRP